MAYRRYLTGFWKFPSGKKKLCNELARTINYVIPQKSCRYGLDVQCYKSIIMNNIYLPSMQSKKDSVLHRLKKGNDYLIWPVL